MKLGWKVVREIDGKLVSSNITFTRYSTTRWTRRQPRYGPLCVFTTRVSAREYKGGIPYHRVYRCKYVPSNVTRVFTPNTYSMHISLMPTGKALAKAVKLIRRD